LKPIYAEFEKLWNHIDRNGIVANANAAILGEDENDEKSVLDQLKELKHEIVMVRQERVVAVGGGVGGVDGGDERAMAALLDEVFKIKAEFKAENESLRVQVAEQRDQIDMLLR